MVKAGIGCRGTDPAAKAAVTAFMQGPPDSQAAQYNLIVEQVLAVQQYLEGLVRGIVAPAFQTNVLGPFGGPDSGGLVVARTVSQWIDGEVCCCLVCSITTHQPALY